MRRDSRFSFSLICLFSLAPIVLIATGRLVNVVPDKGAFREVLGILPYFLYAIAGFLGVRMNQFAILFTALIFGAALYAESFLRFPLSGIDADRMKILSIAVPVSIFLVSVLRSRRLLGRNGLSFLLLSALPWVGLTVAGPFARPALLPTLGAVPIWGVLIVPLLAGLAILRKDRYLQDFHAAVVISLISFFYLIDRGLTPGPGAHWFLSATMIHLTIGMVMVYAIYRLYWSKVYIDELTGLPNRRALDEKLLSLSGQYFIAMGDIDFFKKFNDQFGHDQGDHVLRVVAAHLAPATGSRAYRYGGEEFCIVCEDLSESEVFTLIENARATLASKEFHVRSSEAIRAKTSKKDRDSGGSRKATAVQITMSFGLDKSDLQKRHPQEVIEAADHLLYEAKKRGRNCVVAGFKTALEK